jgi:hypothetical protein
MKKEEKAGLYTSAFSPVYTKFTTVKGRFLMFIVTTTHPNKNPH